MSDHFLRSALHPITEEDIQNTLNTQHSRTPSPTSSASFPTNDDDPYDLTFPLPILPTSSITVWDIETELNLTRAESDQLYHTTRSALTSAGLLDDLDFRHEETEGVLKPVLKAIRSELGFLERNAKRKGGPGVGRLGELLRARVRLINGNEKQRIGRTDGKSDEGAKDGDGDAMDIDDGPAAEPEVFVGEDVNDPASAAGQPKIFHPTTFAVRLGSSASCTAIHISELRSAAVLQTPFSIKDLSYARFIALVSKRLSLRGRGRVGAIIPERHAGVIEYASLSVGSDAGWRSALRAWQARKCELCEFVVDMEPLDG